MQTPARKEFSQQSNLKQAKLTEDMGFVTPRKSSQKSGELPAVPTTDRAKQSTLDFALKESSDRQRFQDSDSLPSSLGKEIRTLDLFQSKLAQSQAKLESSIEASFEDADLSKQFKESLKLQ
jgi:hypothetical protein